MGRVIDLVGGEDTCRKLSAAFYARVSGDPVLRPLFPGKSLRCATEELAAFLVQFFDGDETQMQYRWWLSLRESHTRHRISEGQRVAWLGHMSAALESVIPEIETRADLRSLFEVASVYIVGSPSAESLGPKVGELWKRQLGLDQVVEAIVQCRDGDAMTLARGHVSRRSVMVGILARMMGTGREPLVNFTLDSIRLDPGLLLARFNGRALMHFAAGCGCLRVVEALLAGGEDPNVSDLGSHAPLYRVANGCGSDTGPQVVRALVRAGAIVDHCGGVTRSTALHAAARHGRLAIAMALVDEGASMQAVDNNGFTPLDRARNCRKTDVAEALELRMAARRQLR